MDTNPTLYLASPLGFSEAGRMALPKIVSALTVPGWNVLDPWADSAHGASAHETRTTATLTAACARNEQAIQKSDLVVAVLDGVDVDSGVAAEIGFATASGKTIIGYRGDFRVSGEFPDAVINMQVRYWIEASGGKITRSLNELLNTVKQLLPVG